MVNENLGHLLNIGITIEGVMFGALAGLVTLILVFIIEAYVMKRHFPYFPKKQPFYYSLILNGASTLIGFLILLFPGGVGAGIRPLLGFIYSETGSFASMVLSPLMMVSYIRMIPFAFIFTIIVEYGILTYLLRRDLYAKNIFIYTFKANVLSYIVVVIIPTIITMIYAFAMS